jgi:hypothetical protein
VKVTDAQEDMRLKCKRLHMEHYRSHVYCAGDLERSPMARTMSTDTIVI